MADCPGTTGAQARVRPQRGCVPQRGIKRSWMGEYFTHLLYFRPWVWKFQVVQKDHTRILFKVVQANGARPGVNSRTSLPGHAS